MILFIFWLQQSSRNFEDCYYFYKGRSIEVSKHQDYRNGSVALKRLSVPSGFLFLLVVGARLGEESAFVTELALP